MARAYGCYKTSEKAQFWKEYWEKRYGADTFTIQRTPKRHCVYRKADLEEA